MLTKKGGVLNGKYKINGKVYFSPVLSLWLFKIPSLIDGLSPFCVSLQPSCFLSMIFIAFLNV